MGDLFDGKKKAYGFRDGRGGGGGGGLYLVFVMECSCGQ